MAAFSLVERRKGSLLIGRHCLRDLDQLCCKKPFCRQVKKATSQLPAPPRAPERRGELLHPLLINYHLFSLPACHPIWRKRTAKGQGLEQADHQWMLNSQPSSSSCKRTTLPLGKTHPWDRSSPVSSLTPQKMRNLIFL